MSAMIIGSVERFPDISQRLRSIGANPIMYFNFTSAHTEKMVSRIPHVDVVVLDEDARSSKHFFQVVKEARRKSVRLVAEENMEKSLGLK